mmetsp:Transcript_1105/g.2031  ORF Transcript_1105/g.2031 Transcript_1105/m.2031 type:complete len:171 (+) Transcript_1105:1124-1636(+)
MDFGKTFFDYSDSERQKRPLFFFRDASRCVLYLGLFLQLMGIQLNKYLVIFLVATMDSLFFGASLLMPFERYGPDTTAYINQAAQFVAGQSNYRMISSMQGPCYYPAGHLWHYALMYLVYLRTDYGECILKVTHSLMHTGILLIIVSISYKYFKAKPIRAQLIAFLVVTN